jgi:site-specific DNA recombinase
LEKIEMQHADNDAVIARRGAVLGERLDDGLSAWKRTVRRPGWKKLLERVASAASDGIVVWHTDRVVPPAPGFGDVDRVGGQGVRGRFRAR